MRNDLTKEELERRVSAALEVIVRYGSCDGSHHKDWVLDQAVRNLTGCPTVVMSSKFKNSLGEYPSFTGPGESEEYINLIKEACDGKDGPDTYSWDVGIPP